MVEPAGQKKPACHPNTPHRRHGIEEDARRKAQKRGKRGRQPVKANSRGKNNLMHLTRAGALVRGLRTGAAKPPCRTKASAAAVNKPRGGAERAGGTRRAHACRTGAKLAGGAHRGGGVSGPRRASKARRTRSAAQVGGCPRKTKAAGGACTSTLVRRRARHIAEATCAAILAGARTYPAERSRGALQRGTEGAGRHQKLKQL